MKKLALVLAVLGLIIPLAWASGAPVGKEITVSGVLVDVNCYLKGGHTTDDHDSMKRCGRDCLKDGLPAGILDGKKLYLLVFPGSAFADHVGKKVEVTGTLYDENALIPERASVLEKGKKKSIKLTGKVMM